MALISGKWVKLEQNGTTPGARSSHAVVVVGQKAYVFGGEYTSRVPVDDHVHVFNIPSLTWSKADATGDIPPPRVGVTMAAVGGAIYFYSFDTCTNKGTLLSLGDVGPPNRSYHSTSSDDHRVYVFGGCWFCNNEKH
ncbi:hypothetical protein MKX01_021370 [Papaver californicum]|nr:hypothetical protein MKX01_021370 [Papaver californicum]